MLNKLKLNPLSRVLHPKAVFPKWVLDFRHDLGQVDPGVQHR